MKKIFSCLTQVHTFSTVATGNKDAVIAHTIARTDAHTNLPLNKDLFLFYISHHYYSYHMDACHTSEAQGEPRIPCKLPSLKPHRMSSFSLKSINFRVDVVPQYYAYQQSLHLSSTLLGPLKSAQLHRQCLLTGVPTSNCQKFVVANRMNMNCQQRSLLQSWKQT